VQPKAFAYSNSRHDRNWDDILDDVRAKVIDLARYPPEPSPRELALGITDGESFLPLTGFDLLPAEGL